MLRFVTAMAAICLGVFLISQRQAKQNAVIVFGPPEQVSAQVEQWGPAREEFARRNLAIRRASELRNSKKIEEELALPADALAIVLVLTDGRTAMHLNPPLSAESVFAWIDALPPANERPGSR